MKKYHSFIIAAVVFFSVAVTSFLSSCKQEPDVAFDSKTFFHNKKQWEQLNIKDYSFEYQIGGLVGLLPCTIVVRDGKIHELIPKDDRIPPGVLLDNHSGHYMTIDDIFKEIENTFNNPIYRKENKNTYWYCHEIRVEYDETYFYPRYVAFKHSGKNMYITDTDTSINVTQFEAK